MELIALVIFFFLQQSSAFYPPWGLKATDVSTEEVSVAWETFDLTPKQYQTIIFPLNDSETAAHIQRAFGTSMSWNGLIPGKTYTISVACVEEDGALGQSSVINVTTVPMVPHDPRVSEFVNPVMNAYEAGQNRTLRYAVYGAIMMWDGPEIGYFDGFRVTISPPDGMIRHPIKFKSGDTVSQTLAKRRIIWDLTPGVYYEFFVQTLSNGQKSDVTVVGERMPPEIPCPITVESITPTSVTMTWSRQPHRGIIDGFLVELEPNEGTEIKPGNPADKGRRIINLTPGTIYNVAVYSTSSSVLSYQPRNIKIKTPPFPPALPVSAQITSLTSVSIFWERPPGNVEYYEVVYYPKTKDHGRLRHRTYNPLVQLTSLEKNSEYKLILFSVCNGVYSKPLLASVWTSFLTPVTSTAASTSPQLSNQVTFQDEYEKKSLVTSIPPEEKLYQSEKNLIVQFRKTDRPDNTTKKTIHASTPNKLTKTSENLRETTTLQKLTNSTKVASTQTFAFNKTVAEIQVKPSFISTAASKAAHPLKTTTDNVSSKIVASPAMKTTYQAASNHTLSPIAVGKIIESSTTKSDNKPEIEPFLLPVSTTHILKANQLTTNLNKRIAIESTIFPKAVTNKFEQYVLPAGIDVTESVSTTTNEILTTFEETEKLIPTTTTQQKFVEQTPKWEETTTIKESDIEKVSRILKMKPSIKPLVDITEAFPKAPTSQNVKHSNQQSVVITTGNPKKITFQHTVSSSNDDQANQTASLLNTTNAIQIATEASTTSINVDNLKTFSRVPSTPSFTDKNFIATELLKPKVTDHNLSPTSSEQFDKKLITDVFKGDGYVVTTKISSTTTNSTTFGLTPESSITTSAYPSSPSSTITPFGRLLQTKGTTTGVPETHKMSYVSTEYQAPRTSTMKQISQKVTTKSLENQSKSTLLNSVYDSSTAGAIKNVVSTLHSEVKYPVETTISELDASTISNQGKINPTTSLPHVVDSSVNVANSVLHPTTKQNADERNTEELQQASTPLNEFAAEPFSSIFKVDLELLTSSMIQSSTGSAINAMKTTKPFEYGSSFQRNPTTPSVLKSKTQYSETVNLKPTEHKTVSHKLNNVNTEKIQPLITSNLATIISKQVEQKAIKFASSTASQLQYQPTTTSIDSITTKIGQKTPKLTTTSTTATVITPSVATPTPTTTSRATTPTTTTILFATTLTPTSSTPTEAQTPMPSKTIRMTTSTATNIRTVTSATTAAMPKTTIATALTSNMNATEAIDLEPEDQDSIDFDPNTVPLVEVDILSATSQTVIKNFLNTPNITPGNLTLSPEKKIHKPFHSPSYEDGFTAICRPNNITILVNKSIIGAYESKFGPLHLNNEKAESCKGIEYPTYYRYTIAPNILDCGTRIELNETHVNFTNSISNLMNQTSWIKSFIDPRTGMLINSDDSNPPPQFFHVKLWCTFPLDLNVSTLFPFLPQLTFQVQTFNISGHGEFSAVMQLYKSSAFEEAYPSPPEINLADTLYVGINLLETTDNFTSVVVERCWGTPERNPDHLGFYSIIENGCPAEKTPNGSVKIIENGKGKIAKWKGSVFKFVHYDEVWLHCAIKVCFESDCERNCNNSRKKRSSRINDVKYNIVSAGPVVMAQPLKVIAKPPSTVAQMTTTASESFFEESLLFIIVGVLCVVLLGSCIILTCVITRLRRHQKPKNSSPPMTASSSFVHIPSCTNSGTLSNASLNSEQYLLGHSVGSSRFVNLDFGHSNYGSDFSSPGFQSFQKCPPQQQNNIICTQESSCMPPAPTNFSPPETSNGITTLYSVESSVVANG